MTTPTNWRANLNEVEKARLSNAGFGERVGIGDRPAVLVIDVQNYMVGPPPGSSITDYPSACGAGGRTAIAQLTNFLPSCRELDIPIFYTRFELKRDGSDAGVYIRKRRLLTTEGWCLEDSEGAELVPATGPGPRDVVLVKKKPSAFHGTPLLGMLIDRQIDTVLVVGGSTSNCVRATVVDAVSFNYRAIIVEDCVFDRFELSHSTTLFDLDRQYGDVLAAQEVLRTLQARKDSK
jgi:maleamate amidohydrolase